MEKRFVFFLVLAIAVIFGHLALVQFLRPPQPEDELKKAAGGQPVAESEAPREKAEEAEKAAASDVADATKPAEPATEPHVSSQAPAAPDQWVSLGSYAPDSPYSLLITLNNRGGSIERIELTERTKGGSLRYRNLEERGGYLGEMALTVAPEGCRVNVVGDGTPAALARPREPGLQRGLQPGDVLTQIDGRPIGAPLDLATYLGEKRPGDTVMVTVRRGAGSEVPTIAFNATLGERPFELIRPEVLAPGEIVSHPASLLLSLEKLGDREVKADQIEFPGMPSLRNSNWEVRILKDPDPAVEFHFVLDAPSLAEIGSEGELEFVKRYRMPPAKKPESGASSTPGQHLQVELEVVNRGQQPLKVSYRLDGPNGLPLEGWWYLSKINPRMFASAGARDVVYGTAGQMFQLVGCAEIFDHAQDNPATPARSLFAESEDEQYRTLRYIGVDTQYFLAAIRPVDQGPYKSDVFRRAAAIALGDPRVMPKARIKTANTSFQLVSPVATIEPGKAVRHDFVLYAGPKSSRLLAAYGLEECNYYGWFGWVAKPLSKLLHFFHAVVGNFGLAIVMLTVLVRGCMFPLSRKAAKNAAMMQELAPEMRKIAEKYKNDMEKRAKAQQELFRKHNYNPFGGCWLMFLQLPVFIGLYRCLAVDIELRQAPLIRGIEWCSDLAGPDMLYRWDWLLPAFLGSETGILGPYFNVLPLFTIVLFIVHQQLFTPPATDEQTRVQMQMMKFMTVFIGFLFFKVASGLCLYFIASSLWSVAERVFVPKKKPGEETPEAAKPKPRPRSPGASNSLTGLLDRFTAKSDLDDAGRRPADRRRPRRR